MATEKTPLMLYSGDLGHLITQAFERAMHAEEIDGRTVRRVVSRVIWGEPDPNTPLTLHRDNFGEKI